MGNVELSLSRLSGKMIDGPDDFKASIVEFLVESDLSFVRYFAIACGQSGNAEAQLVPSGAISAFWAGSARLTVTLTEKEVGHLPLLSAARSLNREDEIALHDAIRWKPYWDPDETATRPGLLTWAQLQQVKCRFRDGQERRIIDLKVDPETWGITAVALHSPHAPPGRQELLPISMIDRYDPATAEIRLVGAPSDIGYRSPTPPKGRSAGTLREQ